MCDETFEKISEEALQLARNGGAAKAKQNSKKIRQVKQEINELTQQIDELTDYRVASQR